MLLAAAAAIGSETNILRSCKSRSFCIFLFTTNFLDGSGLTLRLPILCCAAASVRGVSTWGLSLASAKVERDCLLGLFRSCSCLRLSLTEKVWCSANGLQSRWAANFRFRVLAGCRWNRTPDDIQDSMSLSFAIFYGFGLVLTQKLEREFGSKGLTSGGLPSEKEDVSVVKAPAINHVRFTNFGRSCQQFESSVKY